MTDPSPLSSLSSALVDLVARTAPSIVSVHSHRSRATGFVWKSGLIITADEALADEGEVEPSVVASAIERYGIETDSTPPWTR